MFAYVYREEVAVFVSNDIETDIILHFEFVYLSSMHRIQ